MSRIPRWVGLGLAAAAAGLSLVWLWPGEALGPQLATAEPAQPVASQPASPSPVAALASAPAGGAPIELPAADPVQALRLLKACYAADRCHLAGPEGLEEHFAVSRAITERLRRLPDDPAQRAAMAREFIGFPDGHVQAAALELAAALPPSADTVAAVVAALRETHDSVLLEKAYPVLRNWQSRGLNNGYDEMFLSLVSTGGWNAAQSVADNVLPFLHEGNVERFRAAAEKLQSGARQEALRRALRDFELQRRGG